MKKHYVSYEQAVKLKELGFNGNGFKNYIRQGYYKFQNGYISPIKHNGDGILVQFSREDAKKIPAPRLDQAQEWLRKEKGLIIYPEPRFYLGRRPLMGYIYHLYDKDDGSYSHIESEEVYDNYEQALSAAIDIALKILTDKQ